MKSISQTGRIGRYASAVLCSSLLTFAMSPASADLGSNLALSGGADGSSKASGSSYGNVVDGDVNSYWQPDSSSGERIGVKNFGASFNTVVIRELNNATSSWRLEDHDTGQVLATGSSLGSEQVISGFGNQSLYKVNLIIESANTAPRIAEFELYNATGTGGSSSSSMSDFSSSTSPSGGQCNWWGTLYPLCANQNSGWGWEDSQSCIGGTTCSGQPDPYGVVGGNGSSSSESFSSVSSSISSSSSTPSSSSSTSSNSSDSGGDQCNWYGTLYPLCANQNSGWGWEDSQSCIGGTTCSGQPDPYGIVEASASSSSSSSTPESSSSSESSSSVSSSSSSSSSVGGNTGDLSCQEANTVQGFAAMGGGTTGGAGGDVVTVSTGYEIEAALSAQKDSSTPLTIYVNGTISPSNSDGSKFDIKDMNDVSIIGVGDNALFDGIGIKIWRADNVIIRNVTMRYVNIGDKDHITIEGPANNVWVDHNTFYNSLDVDKDYYDELVSGKGDIDNITVSYNILRDSWKTSLWGSGDSDSDHRRVTFLGNHWENANSRLPLFRFGEAHVVNNYYDGVISTGINSRMGATIRIEGNVFENAHNPIVSYYSSELGYWDVEDNTFSNVTWEESSGDGIVAGPDVQSTVSYTPPYSYSRISASDTRNHVLANAGAGVISGCL